MHDEAISQEALARVRELAMALPEVSERLSHGAPAWFVREKRTIAMFSDDHHDDGRLALWVPAPSGEQEALIADDPGRYFRPPYVGPSGWVGVILHPAPDWQRVEELIEDAWRHVAPKRLVAVYDAELDAS